MSPARDAVSELSAVTGLTKTDLRGIWDQVKANNARLRACPRHRFAPAEAVTLGMKLDCLACGGTMGLTDVGSYLDGFKAAGGDPELVWPGYERTRGGK